MDDDIAISVQGVSKDFRLLHQKVTSIKSGIVNVFRKKNKKIDVQHALKNVSFDIKKGEFFGIVGRNGSGKSTLLKIISGIYRPDKGDVRVNGSLVPFIELGVGFNPELSGRENVYLNGALLGFSKKQIDAMYNDIVEFAELEKFMDQKLKNYSSGMQVRLAFSVAIRAESDILVLDEVLAVGDAAFQQKCFDYFEKMRRDKKTVILVTHDMSAVKRFCTRAVIIENGKIKKEGTSEEAANQYLVDNIDTSTTKDEVSHNTKFEKEIEKLDTKSLSKVSLGVGDNLEFETTYVLSESVDVYLGISITHNGVSVIEHNSMNVESNSTPGVEHKIKYTTPAEVFNTGVFGVDVAIFDRATRRPLGYNLKTFQFSVVSDDDETKGGPIKPVGSWRVL